MYFQSHYVWIFPDVLGEIYIFAVIMDPFQTSFLTSYILNTLCYIED